MGGGAGERVLEEPDDDVKPGDGRQSKQTLLIARLRL